MPLSLEDRIESLSDALYHIQELMKSLKSIGWKHMNDIDVLDDIRREIEINESIAEQKADELHQREIKAMVREYSLST